MTALKTFFTLCGMVTSPTSVGNTAVLKNVPRDEPRPVCGSRETWMKAARAGEQLQQLSQLPPCEGSAHKDKLLGRRRQLSLCLALFPSSRTPDANQLRAICSKWHYHTYLGLHNTASEFGPMVGDFKELRRRGRNGTIIGPDFLFLYNLLVDV
jgi:hypothetical protein